MIRVLCVFFLGIILFSCADRVICPAFQSTYILDDSTRMVYYSYAWKLDEATRGEYLANLTGQDTLATDSAMGDSPSSDVWSRYYTYVGQNNQPAERVRKNKYGLVRYEPYWLKNYKLKTAPMEDLLGPETEARDLLATSEDTTSNAVTAFNPPTTASDTTGTDAEYDELELALLDSAGVTSELVPKEKKEDRYRFRYDPKDNFNAEQDYYNKYFGVLLLDLRPQPDADSVEAINSFDEVAVDSLQQEKKGLKGLFSFKKNKNRDDSSTDLQLETEEELEEGASEEESAKESPAEEVQED